MLFNTIDFAIFMPIVFLLYWFVFKKNIKVQNLFLLFVSYFFYACWDWRFLGLIFLSSLVDYLVGLSLAKTEQKLKRKVLLVMSLVANLGVLGFFKYYNFFLESFQDVFLLFGRSLESSSLNILLPVGISFYTFQTLSYTIDVYRKRMEPTNNILSFFAFVSFFPQLVAGPIERASNLLPQFERKRLFDYAKSIDGLRLILLGLFKKMVIADNCAIAVNEIFTHHAEYNGSTLFFGAFFFAFQIYGDFSGYSDIAIGSARLLGFDLMQNFNSPYLSRNLGEFWRRWHISLSTWFRDYVYIPLGGNQVSKAKWIRNIFVVFLLSGFWHGANWTFIIWGFIHALFFLPLIFQKPHKNNKDIADKGKLLPSVKTIFQIGSTFLIVLVAWVFFRADNVSHAFMYLGSMFSKSLFSFPTVSRGLVLFLIVYMVFEWLQRDKKHILEIDFIKSKPLRIGVYYCLVFIIFYFAGDTQPFIYFQF
ncbi:MBOAT family O-acyltransferase [Xanthomarina sp. F2636L]|uniref:MBOAT family O-acyltransferase n=1 Tax=Xanthomarina sp. F2636L TaxID=2996018 RepID=UPI00225E0931|nr:MBOAT family O-acyltransferase [Xanthomarina sp. F2636L]MCX7550557.1 MBOAT family protein [Xanthomarina sp. F2636L]